MVDILTYPYTLQYQKAVSKAMLVLGMIRRSFQYLTKESYLVLYKLLICPHLEYCIPFWSPYLAKDIDLLEFSMLCYQVGQ